MMHWCAEPDWQYSNSLACPVCRQNCVACTKYTVAHRMTRTICIVDAVQHASPAPKCVRMERPSKRPSSMRFATRHWERTSPAVAKPHPDLPPTSLCKWHSTLVQCMQRINWSDWFHWMDRWSKCDCLRHTLRVFWLRIIFQLSWTMDRRDRWIMGNSIPVEIYSILALASMSRLGKSGWKLVERGQQMQAMQMQCPTHEMHLSFAFAMPMTTAWSVCSMAQQIRAYCPFVAKQKMLKWFEFK